MGRVQCGAPLPHQGPQERPSTQRWLVRAGTVAWPCPHQVQGSHPPFCFHPDTGLWREGGIPSFLRAFPEDHGGGSQPCQPGSKSGNRSRLALMDWEFQSPSCCQQKDRAALEDSFSLASTPEAPDQSPPGTWEGKWGARGGASPPALLLRAGVSQGQSAPKSESQQTVATPTPNAKLTNKTGEMKKWGGGKTNQNRTPCPPAQGGGSSQ